MLHKPFRVCLNVFFPDELHSATASNLPALALEVKTVNLHDSGQRASFGLTINWCYVTPLYGAYVADTYWGRYKTISVSVGIAMLGHILMVISALPGVIDKKGSVGVFALSLIITGIGTGGFKANISPLVAEQYKRTKLLLPPLTKARG